MTVRLSDVVGLLDEWYPPRDAESWDAVGLVTGDPAQEVRRILFAVDPSPSVVAEAVEYGADLVVVHHPLLLTPVHGVAATSPKGRVVHDLMRSGIALFTAHTNADVPAQGVNESLARALGIRDPRVIVAGGSEGLDKLVVYVPEPDATKLRDALAAAGAGAIGDYDSCSFTTAGEGRFRPLEGANPVIGRVGDVEVVAEARLEMVVPRSRRAAVLDAMRANHPYEEVAFDVTELADLGDSRTWTRGHGRIGSLAAPVSLREFAEQIDAALPACAHGVRVAGDPERVVSTVAVASGSGDFLLDTMLSVEADVFVTSDLRHHRAGAFLEHDHAALIDVAHWAAEWTWLPVVQARVVDALAAREDTVDTRVSTTVTDPWTFRV